MDILQETQFINTNQNFLFINCDLLLAVWVDDSKYNPYTDIIINHYHHTYLQVSKNGQKILQSLLNANKYFSKFVVYGNASHEQLLCVINKLRKSSEQKNQIFPSLEIFIFIASNPKFIAADSQDISDSSKQYNMVINHKYLNQLQRSLRTLFNYYKLNHASQYFILDLKQNLTEQIISNFNVKICNNDFSDQMTAIISKYKSSIIKFDNRENQEILNRSNQIIINEINKVDAMNQQSEQKVNQGIEKDEDALKEIKQQLNLSIGSKKQEQKNQKNSRYVNNYINENKIFIPPVVVSNQNKEYDYKQFMEEFLKSQKKVLLLKGEHGYGKSMCLKYLYEKLKKQNSQLSQNKIKYLQLKSLDQQHLKEYLQEISYENQIVLLDGYDEILENSSHNQYQIKQLEKHKRVKFIITCSSESLKQNYQEQFYPNEGQSLYQEVQIQPFDDNQIKEYINQVTKDQENKNLHKLLENEQMKQQLRNPLILKNAILAWKGNQLRYNQTDNNVNIYELMINNWHIEHQNQNNQQTEENQYYSTQQISKFIESLAFNLHLKNKTEIQKSDSFFQKQLSDNRLAGIIKKCPLKVINKSKYTFIHKSYQAFLVVKYIINKVVHLQYQFQPYQIVKEEIVCNFIQQELRNHKELFQKLMVIVLKTRIDPTPNMQKNAAAAITILNVAGQNFSGMNLSKISIPNAYLIGGYFQNTNFQESNLENVSFSRSYLLNTNFNKAILKGVNFGVTMNLKFGQVINSIDIDRTTRYLIAGGYNGKIAIYSLENLQLVKQWNNGTAIKSIKFLPNTDRIIATYKNVLKIWDILTTNHIRTLIGHNDNILSMCCSPDGKKLSTGSNDKLVKIWDLQIGKNIKSLEGHKNNVSTVNYSYDGKKIISGSFDKSIKIWDCQTGKQLKTLLGHHSYVWCVCFSPDAKRVVSCSYDNSIKIWDAQIGNTLRTLIGHNHIVRYVAYSPDGRKIVSGSNNIKIWNSQTGRNLKTLYGHNDGILYVNYFTDGKRIVSGSYDKTIKIWDAQIFNKTLQGHTKNVYTINYSPDGKRIVSGSRDNTIKIWNAQTGFNCKTLKQHKDSILSVCFSADSTKIISGSRDNTIKIWNIQSGQCIKSLEGHSNCIYSVYWSPDNTKIISGARDNTVKIWEAEKGILLKSLTQHKNTVSSVCYNPNGEEIISGSYDNTIKIWKVSTGQCLATLKGHTNWISTVSYSLKGDKILSGSWDDTIKIWNSFNQQISFSIKISNHHILSLSFSPDQNFIAIGSEENIVKILNIQTQKVKLLQGHNGYISSVCYSPDGKQIASCSWDNTIKIWSYDQSSQNSVKTINFNENQQNLQLEISSYNLIRSIPQSKLFASDIKYEQSIGGNYMAQLMKQEGQN